MNTLIQQESIRLYLSDRKCIYNITK